MTVCCPPETRSRANSCMPTYLALFRALNVGGRNILPMRELVALLEELGARSVRTYIQSGNAVFTTGGANPARLAGRIAAAVARRRGFTPHVQLLRLADLERAIRANPFPEAVAEPQTLHLGFLAAAPAKPDLPALEALRRPSERYRLAGRVFYLHAPEGVARSRLAAGAERVLGVALTDRNWRTVCALRDLASG